MLKLQRNMDIYSLSTHIYYFSRLFGLAGYTLHQGKFFATYKCSKFRIFYCILWSFLITCSFPTLFVVQTRVYNNPFYYSSLFVVLQIFVTIVLVSQVTSLINSKRILTIYNELDQYDTSLNSYPRKSHIFKAVLVQISLALIYSLSLSYYTIKTVLQIFVNNGILFAMYCWFMYFCGYGILWTTYSQFVYFVIMLKQRFSYLNERLRKEITSSRIITCSKTATSSSSFIYSQETKLLAIPSLKTTGKLHKLLCDISEYTNSTYSFTILLTTAHCFFEITWLMYAIALGALIFVGEEHAVKYNGSSFSSVPALIALYATKVVTIVVTCAQTAAEVSRLLHYVRVGGKPHYAYGVNHLQGSSRITNI